MKNSELKIGDYCPLFSLPNQYGELINIHHFIGERNLVIYFYPKDDTPGCTKEACAFRDRYEEFKDLGCEVFGISSDSLEKHQKFATKHRLSFTLLSDSSNDVRKMFGVPANLFGLLPGRVTYIIDKKGMIRGIYNSQTDPIGHIEKALETVRLLDR
jgi:peroxiredoxin Q/BCP